MLSTLCANLVSTNPAVLPGRASAATFRPSDLCPDGLIWRQVLRICKLPETQSQQNDTLCRMDQYGSNWTNRLIRPNALGLLVPLVPCGRGPLPLNGRPEQEPALEQNNMSQLYKSK